jgi:hypothetical protein
LLGIEISRPPSPAPRKPRQAVQPAPPAHRAESTPAATPAKRAEPNTVRAIVVDPKARTVEEIRLATKPGNPKNGYGTQLDQGAVANVIGSETFTDVDMIHAGEVVLVDRDGDRGEHFWRYGDDDAPVGGVGVIVGYDAGDDAYRDTSLKLEEVREVIEWGAEEDHEDDARAHQQQARP